MDSLEQTTSWRDVLGIDDLADGPKVVKPDGKQIVVFQAGSSVYACNNRCPHEGYPLAEGTLSDDCILTCNWHNWKFNLSSGETLIGGDALRRYPARVSKGRVLIDIADPPAEEVIASALGDLRRALDDHEYSRIARNVARIVKAGGDPLEALRETVTETQEKFQYGTGHAVAAAADWLALLDAVGDDPAQRMVCIVEPIGHFAWDTRRQSRYPFPDGSTPFEEEALVAAIEAEDEVGAIAITRGGLQDGADFDAFHPALARAALAHYQDFGHALIYTVKSREFVARLGPAVLAPVVLMMVRSLVYATREDLIPEFKSYRPALDSWHGGKEVPDIDTLRTRDVQAVLSAITDGGGDPLRMFDALMDAACWQMLHMDLSYSLATAGPVQNNVGWLDFTHAVTFANAVRRTCERFPELWPAGLLQIGCFLGRNARYVDDTQDVVEWHVDDPAEFVRQIVLGTVDHGQAEYIVAAHILKTSTAILDELTARPEVPWAGIAASALNRFVNAPLKRKHALRDARQAIDIVSREA